MPVPGQKNGSESRAAATKASARANRVTFTGNQISEEVGATVPDRGGVRVAVELRDDYPVVSAQDVRLSVSIGEGQTGLVSVFLGGTRVSRTPAPIELLVGKGSVLRDKLLEVRTIVNDVNNQTNKMSVTYQLTGGVEPLECISKGEVLRENEPLDFTAVFSFL